MLEVDGGLTMPLWQWLIALVLGNILGWAIVIGMLYIVGRLLDSHKNGRMED